MTTLGVIAVVFSLASFAWQSRQLFVTHYWTPGPLSLACAALILAVGWG